MVLLRRSSRGLLLIALLAAAGCGAPRGWQPDVDPNSLADVEFQAYLADAPVVTVAEGFRAMLILADGEDTCKTFEDRRAKLEERGIARPAWKLEPDHMLDKGTLAYMIRQICRIHGGINLNVFGSIGLGERRYALREMIYEDIMAESADFAVVRGGELVSAMSKADAWMQKNRLYEVEPLELPPEPPPGATTEWMASPTTAPSERAPVGP